MHLNIRLSGDTANKPTGEPGMPVGADRDHFHLLSSEWLSRFIKNNNHRQAGLVSLAHGHCPLDERFTSGFRINDDKNIFKPFHDLFFLYLITNLALFSKKRSNSSRSK